jgi:hypothetical protein
MRLDERREAAAFSNNLTTSVQAHTLCNQRPPGLPTQHPAPNLRRKFVLRSGRCCGSHRSTHRRFLIRATHLCILAIFLSSEQRGILVGLNVGLLLATSFHSPRGTARWRYAIAARQCGSIEGRENPGPQT